MANPLLEKSYSFAVAVVKIYQVLIGENKGYTLPRQLLRAGTSVGANIEEANGAMSKGDFRLKTSIAYKESREVQYWLRVLHDTNYISTDTYNDLYGQAQELSRILRATLNTLNEERKLN